MIGKRRPGGGACGEQDRRIPIARLAHDGADQRRGRSWDSGPRGVRLGLLRTTAENGPPVIDENRPPLVSVDKGVAVVRG